MMKRLVRMALALLLIGVMGCEKPVVESVPSAEKQGDVNVVLRFSADPAVTRGTTDISEICSRVNLAVFSTDGTKAKAVAQKEGDSDFGTVEMSLTQGTYKLVVIAHDCDGSATITSTEKVTFPNNKVTDTFYYYGDLEVSSEKKTYDLELTRAVAMFRLVMTDQSVPSNVTTIRFYYQGGSSTFSPADGYGCVNSKQTELRTVSVDGVYEIYTMPHTEQDVLTKLVVTALDANENVVKERVFEDVPIVRNQVTSYSGEFFDSESGTASGSGTFHITANPEWDAVNNYNF